jgi:hypothetical protein
MKWYWLRIALGALVIFCVGYAGISVARAAKRRVVGVAGSSSDISIPLPFVSFTFDGAKGGTFRKVVFHRSNPRHLNGVDIVVRVTDPGLLERVGGCNLTVDNPTQINQNTTFRCAGGEADLEPFGTVILEPAPGSDPSVQATTLPLVIQKKVVEDLQGRGRGTREAERLQTQRLRELADSLRTLTEAAGRATTSEARDAIMDQINDIKSEMSDVQDAIVEAAEARTEAAKVAADAQAEARRAAAEARSKANQKP